MFNMLSKALAITSVHTRGYHGRMIQMQVNSTKAGFMRPYSDEHQFKRLENAYYDEIKDLPNNPDKMLIDVREPKEIEDTGSIPTSINIPLGQVEAKLTNCHRSFENSYGRSKPTKDQIIIFSCQSGRRCKEAAKLSLKLGFKNVKCYEGSWNEWSRKHPR